MVNSNRDRYITYRLRDTTLYRPRGWKSLFSPTVYWFYTPSAGTPSSINVMHIALKMNFVCYNSVANNAGLPAKSREIQRKFEPVAVQGHLRLSPMVQIGSTYNFLIHINSRLNVDVSRTVFYTVRHKKLHPSYWYNNLVKLCHNVMIFGTSMNMRMSYRLPVWQSL